MGFHANIYYPSAIMTCNYQTPVHLSIIFGSYLRFNCVQEIASLFVLDSNNDLQILKILRHCYWTSTIKMLLSKPGIQHHKLKPMTAMVKSRLLNFGIKYSKVENSLQPSSITAPQLRSANQDTRESTHFPSYNTYK